MIGLAGLGLAIVGCTGSAPKGQVVAVVNGHEITSQDLAAEARGEGAKGGQDPKLILQHVVARVLLAQSAHDRKFDRYPGYPSDIARLQQDFLAQKAVQSVLKPAVTPNPGELDRFMTAHPYAFADRTRLQVDEIRFQSGDDMKSLSGADTLDGVVARLKSLNVPFDRASRTLDTAELPAALAQKLTALSQGQLFLVRDHDIVLGMVVQNRQPVSVPTEQARAIAAQLMSRLSTQGQIDAEVNRLRSQAKIVYQPGYAPPKPGVGPAPAPRPPAAQAG